MKRWFLTTVAVAALYGASGARADMPVIDAASIARLIEQVKVAQQQLQQLEQQVHMMEDIPQDLITQVGQLMNLGIQNPLQGILQNIQAMMTGTGLGACPVAQQTLTQNQYAAAQGGDFTAGLLNAGANRNAALYACSQQMLQSTQNRLADLPGLLDQLQGAHDITQATAINGRIQYEVANITAQQQQIQSMTSMAQLQQLMADQAIAQKMRNDAQEMMNATRAGPGGAPAPIPAPPPFAGN